MHVEAETSIARPPSDVFAYLARAEELPRYVEDFDSVSQESSGEPALGTTYSYKMKRGAEGTSQIQRLVIAREVLLPRRVEEPEPAAA